jgi:hypothetical protein
MSRRLRLTVAVVVCAGITTAAHAAQSPGAHPTVKPRTGKASTRFTVSFRAPQSTVKTGVTQVHYLVDASLRSHPKGCVSSISSMVNYAIAGKIVHAKLNPKSAGGRWCNGRFQGRVEEFVSPVCVCPGPGQVMCPELVCPVAVILPAPQTIGKFSFRVRK